MWRTAGAVVVIGMLGASLLLYTILSRPRLTTSTSPSSTAAAPDVDGSRQSVGTPPELPRGEGHPSALPTQPEHGQGAPSSPAQSLPSAKESPAVPRVRDYEPIPELRDVHFRSGRSGGAVIRPGDVTILDANAAWLRANPGHLVLIEGHSDNRGPTTGRKEFNMDVGERRALAAMNRLIAQGVDPSRITIVSYGEERPHCTDDSERCRSQNRRARFLVKPR